MLASHALHTRAPNSGSGSEREYTGVRGEWRLTSFSRGSEPGGEGGFVDMRAASVVTFDASVKGTRDADAGGDGDSDGGASGVDRSGFAGEKDGCGSGASWVDRHRFEHEPTQSGPSEALDEPADIAYSTDATEAFPENDPLAQRVWTGKFVFNLDTHPQFPQIGWRCGYGRWSKDPLGRFDIALCLPDDSKRLRVHGNHLAFSFLVETGAFAIRASNLTWVDTQNVDRNELCVLNKPQQTLEIGEAKYEFRYTIGDANKFVESRKTYMRDHMLQSLPPICEMPTPSEEDIHVGKWRLLGPIGQGTESVVVSAISSCNRLVVVKTLDKLRFRNHHDVSREIHRHRNITDRVARSEDSRYLLAFHESIAGDQTTYLIFSPHARHDLAFLLTEPRAHNRQLLGQLFLQALRGVRALHTAKFMHRDLKPANIGISRMDPPHAVVLDLGCTAEVEERSASKSRPRPGTTGTIGYIAPEMENVKCEIYGMEVDIWAMACVGMELLLPRNNGPSIPWNHAYYFPLEGKGRRYRHFNPWRTFATLTQPCPTEKELEAQRKTYSKEMATLCDSEDKLEHLVCEMLSVGPHWRPGISEVIKRFEALQIDDWQGQSTVGRVPPPLLR